MKGLIHIYTGDGKGKTTAAVGLAVRMAGNDQKVLFTQFLKDGTSNEISILETIKQIETYSCKEKFKFVFMMDDAEKCAATKLMEDYFMNIANKIFNADYSLLVLDEILDVVGTGLLKESQLVDFLEKKPENLEIVLTGRSPSETLLELADYVTIMQKEKHPYDQGIAARVGIEY